VDAQIDNRHKTNDETAKLNSCLGAAASANIRFEPTNDDGCAQRAGVLVRYVCDRLDLLTLIASENNHRQYFGMKITLADELNTRYEKNADNGSEGKTNPSTRNPAKIYY